MHRHCFECGDWQVGCLEWLHTVAGYIMAYSFAKLADTRSVTTCLPAEEVLSSFLWTVLSMSAASFEDYFGEPEPEDERWRRTGEAASW